MRACARVQGAGRLHVAPSSEVITWIGCVHLWVPFLPVSCSCFVTNVPFAQSLAELAPNGVGGIW